MVLEYDPVRDPRQRALGILAASGHVTEPIEPEPSARVAPSPRWPVAHRGEIAAALSGALVAAGWAASGASEAVSSVSYALAIVAGGTIVWRRAIVSIAARTLDMNVLMTIAVLGAAALGEWGEGATVVFLFALGGVLESRSLARTRRSIAGLLELAPETARVARQGSESVVPTGEVRVGETVVVRPGERVPLDGTIVTGRTALDESPITGESVPVDKEAGDAVFAGTLNTSGLITMTVGAEASSSTLARILHLVEAAQASRAPVQRFVDRFSRAYTPAVIAVAVLIGVGLPIAGSLGAPWAGFEAWRDWVYRSLVLLVVSCPCALVISTPVSIVSAITRATRDGILVKGGAFLELAAGVKVVALDKTGTLTHGRPELARVVVRDGEDPGHVLRLAAALETHSNHPVARAVAGAVDGDAGLEEAAGVLETAGAGVEGILGGDRVVVGSVRHAAGLGTLETWAEERSAELEAEGMTVLTVVRYGAAGPRTLGLLAVADTVRPESAALVAGLRSEGVGTIVMLTGDNRRVASGIAASAGVTGFRAELMPEEKTAALRELRERHGVTVMVGDGVNDAPALSAADIGIAMGAAGSDTAIEAADVALMRDDLTAVPRFIALGRRTMRVVRQNVALSLGTKALVLVLAAAGKATLWMAVFADTGIALVVILNGLRLLRPVR